MNFDFIYSNTMWIVIVIVFTILTIGMSIFYYLLLKKTHVVPELKAFFSNTPIGLFFQDNKFVEWKPITPINGIIYDNFYGPFIVTTTYVDKKTKNIIIPFDVDMDGDRTSDLKSLVNEFKDITNNEKNIETLRMLISRQDIDENKNIKNVTSHIKFGNLKNLFFSSGPHSIKSKIEKIVAERVLKYGQSNYMQAIIVFGAIFGIIVLAAIILKNVGGA